MDRSQMPEQSLKSLRDLTVNTLRSNSTKILACNDKSGFGLCTDEAS